MLDPHIRQCQDHNIRHARETRFLSAKTKTQISCVVTTADQCFCFSSKIVQYLIFLNPKFLASSLVLCAYMSVCVRPGLKPLRLFSDDMLFYNQLFFSSITGTYVAVHGGAMCKMHTCLFCGKVFERQDHMIRHVRIHTGHKPWSCNLCGRRFNTDSSLKRHQITHMNMDLSGK